MLPTPYPVLLLLWPSPSRPFCSWRHCYAMFWGLRFLLWLTLNIIAEVCSISYIFQASASLHRVPSILSSSSFHFRSFPVFNVDSFSTVCNHQKSAAAIRGREEGSDRPLSNKNTWARLSFRPPPKKKHQNVYFHFMQNFKHFRGTFPRTPTLGAPPCRLLPMAFRHCAPPCYIVPSILSPQKRIRPIHCGANSVASICCEFVLQQVAQQLHNILTFRRTCDQHNKRGDATVRRMLWKGRWWKYSTTQLRSVTCHMGSHSVTCHPTQVYAPRLTQPCRLVFDLPTREGWKAELT